MRECKIENCSERRLFAGFKKPEKTINVNTDDSLHIYGVSSAYLSEYHTSKAIDTIQSEIMMKATAWRSRNSSELSGKVRAVKMLGYAPTRPIAHFP